MVYATVGFGGGSSYLAILALTSLNYTEIRTTALLCNIVVVSNASYRYYKSGYYHFKRILPLVLSSVPLAFIGATLKISQQFFFILLALTLLLAAALMLISDKEQPGGTTLFVKQKTRNLLKSLCYGGGIGFLSGIVGIGGGIFLAPLLHLTKWDNSKRIAATASFFILVNSIAGLSGQVLNPHFNINPERTLLLVSITFIGGYIGTRMAIKTLSPLHIKKITALLVAFVALKILWDICSN